MLLNDASLVLAQSLRTVFPNGVLGPEFPLVSKIQLQYLKDIWIKFPKDHQLNDRKLQLDELIQQFRAMPRFKSVRVVVNVDA